VKKSLPVMLILAGILAAWDANYNLGLEQGRVETTLINSLTFSQELSRHLSLNGATSFQGLRNWGQGRFCDSRSGRGWLSWRPRGGMELATTFTRAIVVDKTHGVALRDEVADNAIGSLRYAPADWLSMNMQAGLHTMDKWNQSHDTLSTDDGTLYDMSATVNRRLFRVISTNFSVAEARAFGNVSDNGRDNISARVGYNFPDSWNGGSFNAEIGANRNFLKSYRDEYWKKGDEWSHSESLVLPELIQGIFMEMSGHWTYDATLWTGLDPDSTQDGDYRDKLTNGRRIGCTLVWEMMDDIDLDISVSRALQDEDYKVQITGVDSLFDVTKNTDDRLLSFRLVYTPGSSNVTFHRVVNLYMKDTEGVWGDSFGNTYQDDTDSDELREILGVTARIPVNRWFTLKGEMQGQRRETIFLMAAMSGQSSRSSTYSVRPGYECNVGSGWKVDHSVKLSADYTTYFFPEYASGGNRLSRRLDSFFTFDRVSSDSTVLGVRHTFAFRDQGRYQNRLFSRTYEAVNSRLTFNLGFHVSANVGITPNYGWEYVWNNRLDQGISTDDHIHHVGIRSVIRILGGVLSTNITRTFRMSGDPSYWHASMNFNYLL